MPKKMKVPANMDDLRYAFEDCSIEKRYVLDLKTGCTLYVSDEFMEKEEVEELEEKIDGGLGKLYRAIPESSIEESYEDMEDFVGTVREENLKEELCIALDGKGSFRRFKDNLNSYPSEKERWFKFKDAKLTQRIKEWLEDEGIEIEEIKPAEIQEVTRKETSDLKSTKAAKALTHQET